MSLLKRAILISLTTIKNFKYVRTYSSSLYEPEYLEGMKSKFPLYDTLNIQLKGYDYPVLENYQKYLHNLIKNMDISVEDCWATPAQVLQISTYKPQSEIISSQYKLNIYERTVQVTDLSTLQLPILLRVIEASTPSGVTVDIVPHQEYHEEIRYVPDSELTALKHELDEMGGPSKKKSS